MKDINKISEYNSTVLSAAPEWKLATSTLFGFGPGARYLYWEVALPSFVPNARRSNFFLLTRMAPRT